MDNVRLIENARKNHPFGGLYSFQELFNSLGISCLLDIIGIA